MKTVSHAGHKRRTPWVRGAYCLTNFAAQSAQVRRRVDNQQPPDIGLASLGNAPKLSFAT